MDGSSNLFITWFPIILLWFVIFMNNRKKKQVKKIIKNRIQGDKSMEEIIRKFMNKTVYIYLIENEDLGPTEGVITSLNNGWITVETKKGEQAINCGYIIKIKEKPVKKK
ncbi:MAG: hypothetical protein ACI4IF_07160 [Acutalibacteraceae bacterium]